MKIIIEFILGKSSNISNTLHFLSSNKTLVIRAGTHKMLFRLATMEDPKMSDLGLCCLYKPFLQATSVRNFKIFTIPRTLVKSACQKLIFLFLKQNICCGYSKELSQ